MNLKKNLICLTLASCVAHASVASQAMLTKVLVIKSDGQLISDSKSDLIEIESPTMDEQTNTIQWDQRYEEILSKQSSVSITDDVEDGIIERREETDEIEGSTAEQDQPSKKTESSTVDHAEKEKSTTKQKQKKEETSETELDISYDVDMEESTTKQKHVSETTISDTVDLTEEEKSTTKQKQRKEETSEAKPSISTSDDVKKDTEKQRDKETSQEKVSESFTVVREKTPKENDTTMKRETNDQRDIVVKYQEVAKKSTYTDPRYVTEALNLIDPYIYHLTKVGQSLRFFDGSKEKILMHNVEWRYQDDEGKGSTNYMKLLFPSNSGTLNTGTSADRECFSSTCKPTAKLIADMACYFHNHARNPASSDTAQAYLNQLMEKDKDFIAKVLLRTEAKNFFEKHGIKIPEGEVRELHVDDEKIDEIFCSEDKDSDRLTFLYMKLLNPKQPLKSKNKKAIVRKKLEALCDNIKQETFVYLPVDHFVKFDKDKKQYDIDINSFKLVLRLLVEGSYMIANQETTDVKGPMRFVPNEKLISDVMNDLQSHVENLEDPEVIGKVQKDFKELKKKDLRKLILQTEARDILKKYEVVIPEGEQKIGKCQIKDDTVDRICQEDKNLLIYLHAQLNPENRISEINISALSRLLENIKEGTFDYFSAKHFIKFDKEKNSYDVDVNSLKMILSNLTSDHDITLNEQETEEVDPKKVLPKYMPEKMLMMYFFLTQNEEKDIQDFYDRVKENLDKNIVDPGDPKEALDKLSKRIEVVNELKYNENSPYKSPVVSNASTFSISKVSTKDRKVTFQQEKFQDCADIAVRHIVNLLMYDKEHEWSNVLKDVDETKMQPELDKILKGIKNHGSVDFKTLKERLQIFFLHQKKVGADAVDINTRSLWNYAISNMNQEQTPGLYKIKYSKSEYELSSGYENSLKILYNIACALNISSAENRKQAKKVIDGLKSIKDEDAFRLAVETVYRLFNENISIDKSGSSFNLTSDKSKWIGKAVVRYNDVEFFIVEQRERHAEVTFDPVEKYNYEWIKNHREDILKDDIIALLVCNRVNVVYKEIDRGFYKVIDGSEDPDEFENWSRMLSERMPLFYELCTIANGSIEKPIMIKFYPFKHEREYVINFQTLMFLRGVQGEHNNENQIDKLMSYCFENCFCDFHFDKKNLKLKQQEDSVSMFIIKNYLLKTEQWNPERQSWGETLKSFNKDNVVTANGIEYYCSVEDDGVTLYPICNDVDMSEVVIPAKVNLNDKEYKVVALGVGAFSEAKFMKVSFEEGLESFRFGKDAFMGCSNLTTVHFPPELKKLYLKGNFGYCPKLEKVVFPQNIESLHLTENLFDGCEKLQPIDISTFTSMNELYIGYRTSSIYCLVDGKISIPKNLKKLRIDFQVFEGLKDLQALELNDGLEELYVGRYAFAQTSLALFKIPKSVTKLKIENSVFDKCKCLTELEIPDERAGIEVSDDVRELSKLKKAMIVYEPLHKCIQKLCFGQTSESKN